MPNLTGPSSADALALAINESSNYKTPTVTQLQKLDNLPADADKSPVASVNGRTGAITLTAADLGAAAEADLGPLETALQPESELLRTIPIRTSGASGDSLVYDDLGGAVLMASASANTFTIPTNGTVPIPIGGYITLIQSGAGETTVSASAGVTLNGVGGGSASLGGIQWRSVTLMKIATDAWAAPNLEVV